MKRMGFLWILATLVMVFALQAIPAQAYTVGAWTRIYEGIESATGYVTSPRLMRAFALRISLRNPAITMYASHDNGGSPYEVALQTTPAFLSDHGMEVAINACFFDAGLSPNTNIEGLLISNGTLVSSWQAARDGELHLTSDKIATIVNHGSTSGVYTGAAGAEFMLMSGNPMGDNGTPEPRTSGGITQDGKYLILVVVDGRQSGWSLGATIYDMALWQQSFGAYNAMCFDGGGSTTMTRADVGDVNRPCYGYDRSVGASLGANSTGFSQDGPDAVCQNGKVDIVRRGNMSAIYDYNWNGSAWGDTTIGGLGTSAPAICSSQPGWLDVFVRGSGNNCYHAWSRDDGANWTAFGENLGGGLSSGPDACSWGANRMDLVCLSGTTTYHKYWNGSSWSGWISRGGSGTSAPCICSWGANRLDIFVRGGGANNCFRSYSTDGGATWSGFGENLGGGLDSAPDAVSWGPNRIDVVCRAGSLVYRKYWNGSTWSGWGSLGGNIIGDPTICSSGVNCLDIYARAPNDHLNRIYTTNGGTSWSAWINMGPYF